MRINNTIRKGSKRIFKKENYRRYTDTQTNDTNIEEWTKSHGWGSKFAVQGYLT